MPEYTELTQRRRALRKWPVAAVTVVAAWAMTACGVPIPGVRTAEITGPTTTEKPTSTTPASHADLMKQSAEIMQRRLTAAGYSGASVAMQGDSQIVVTVPSTNSQAVADLVSAQRQLDFRDVDEIGQSSNNSDFANWNCGDPLSNISDQMLFACDSSDQKYLLGPVFVSGQRVVDAEASIPQGGVAYNVTLTFDATGADEFAQATAKLVTQVSPQNQFAIVLDGEVVSAPVVQSTITGGQAQITGSFTQQQAETLAASLSSGALPLQFDVGSVSTISATGSGQPTTVVALTARAS